MVQRPEPGVYRCRTTHAFWEVLPGGRLLRPLKLSLDKTQLEVAGDSRAMSWMPAMRTDSGYPALVELEWWGPASVKGDFVSPP